MATGLSMGVFHRGVVLGLALLALTARGTDAAPIVIEQQINAPLGPSTLAGSFTFDNDIALFHILFGPGTFTLIGISTSAASGFDPILALFGPEGTPVPYLTADGGESASPTFGDIDADVQLPLYTLTGGFTYTLAVSQFGPAFGNFPKNTLAEGFELDADEFRCFTILDPTTACEAGAQGMFGGQLGTFSLDLTVTSADTAPIPEPGTLSLMALGTAGAALLRRRRARRHTTTQ